MITDNTIIDRLCLTTILCIIFLNYFQVVFYKRLHKVYFTHAIPKSASGKILRKELRAKLASPASA